MGILWRGWDGAANFESNHVLRWLSAVNWSRGFAMRLQIVSAVLVFAAVPGLDR